MADKSNNISYLHKVLGEQIMYTRLYGGYFSVVVVEVPVFSENSFESPGNDSNRVNDELNIWLSANVRKNESSVKYKEGKYVLVFNSIRNINQLSSAVERIYNGIISEKLSGLDDRKASIKIGISVFPFDGETPDALIRKAEEAGSMLKPEEKLFYRFYNECIVML